MRAIWILALALVMAPVPARACGSGEYDLLDWMTLDSDLAGSYHLEGNSNPLYTSVWSDKFWWLKDSNGDTWDIKLFDSGGVYDWITEVSYGTPQDYKKFISPPKMGPRCVQGGEPGTTTTWSDSSYYTFHNCNWQSTQDVGYVVYDFWGPYNMSLGGSLSANTPTLILSYRWGCNSSYSSCSTKEALYLQARYGLVRWESYSWQSGAWHLDSQATFNTLVSGGPSITWQC